MRSLTGNPDPGDIGFGHSPEQVAAFKSPNTSILSDYIHAVVNNSNNGVLNGLGQSVF